MKTIKITEPESGMLQELWIHPVKNFVYPGWVIFIPQKKNILLFRENDEWQVFPQVISPLYALVIGNKLKELNFID